MSDFTNSFWSVFITAITLIGIAACLLLLWLTSKAKVKANQNNTTGHVWDEDLCEMNNPLPRWWVFLFIATIVFSLVYLWLYPGLGSYAGKYAWSSAAEHQADVLKGRKDLAPLYAKFDQMAIADIAKDTRAMAMGERLFMNNCAQCHGSDAGGSKGYPNLTDTDWLHGGLPENIEETITKGRVGVMPPMAAAVGSTEDVRNLAHYVLSLSGNPHDSLRAGLGKFKFAACAACHGPTGKGNTAIGAPNLSDDIWLHGYGESAIVSMINNGKVNRMPAQEGKLTASQIHVLAAYVWGLSQSKNHAQ